MESQMEKSGNRIVPEHVELAYRVVGKTHVFSSKGINGLVHVGSHDREKAFRDVIPALNKHVSHAYGCEAAYKSTISYADFCKHLKGEDDILGGFVTFTLANPEYRCQ